MRNDGTFIYPKPSLLEQDVLSQLEKDVRYHSDLAMEYDLAWQAIQKGYIGTTETYKEIEVLPLYDNYVFARKYFHKAWVCMCCCYGF